MHTKPVAEFLALGVAFAVSLSVWAADSPQFRGPERDGIFADTGLLKAWPESGPALLWQFEGVGQGYSSVAVVDGVAYVNGMGEDGQGYLLALDAQGQPLWKVPYGPETQNAQARGSRGTPTVDGDRIYVMSGVGGLSCHNRADGNLIWQVDVMKEFGGAPVSWDIAESPLIHGNLVFATPGGPDASVVALDKTTGKTVWKSQGFSEPSAYCSPNIYTFGGRDVLVTMTAKSVVGVDAKTGKPLWTHPHETEYDIHACTPVVQGSLLYYTGGYGSGGGALEVSADGSIVTPKWSDKNLDCQHHGVVLVDGYIYGTGHKSRGLKCLELATGKLMWSTDEISQGDVIYADGMLYVYEGPQRGIVSLVKATPEGFERTGSFAVPKARDKHWANPAIADGRLYIRHAGTLYAYDIAAK
jgi:outer membrane protein assembly factor BamB